MFSTAIKSRLLTEYDDYYLQVIMPFSQCLLCMMYIGKGRMEIFSFFKYHSSCSFLLEMLEFVLVISLIFSFGETKMIVLMGESYKDCTKGPIKFLDWTGVEFVYENDTTYFMNGNETLWFFHCLLG